MMLVLALGASVSCTEDTVTPEVSVAEGTVDYFTEAMDFPSTGGTKTLNFTSNVKWSIAISETQNSVNWCTVSQSEGSAGTYNISVTVGENAGYDDRNVVLVLSAGELKKNIIVNQKQKNAITLTTNRFEIGNEGGTIDIEVKANVDYSVEIPESYKGWISQSSKTRAMSTKSLSFNISESKEYDKREGEIRLVSGDIIEIVKIYQSGSAILVLSQNEFNLSSEGGTVSIDISSNFEYEVDMPDVDWVKPADKTRAVSSHTLVYNVSENTSHDNREAVIVFKDTNSDKKESVTIKQKQKDAIILTNDKVELPQEGGVFPVDVNSNVDYSIEIPSSCSSWLSRTSAPASTVTRALVKTTPYFKVSNSENYDKREGEIIFKYNEITEIFKVYQSGGAILILSQDTYNIEGGATTISVQLKSNIDYTVSISNDWISEVSTRAVSSSIKNFNVAKNKTGKSRTGKISFTSSDGKRTATVTVTQATFVEAKSLTITPSGQYNTTGGDNILLNVNTQKTFTVSCSPSNAVVDYEWSSSDPSLLTVNGSGSTATIKVVGFGNPKVIVKEKNSGMTVERGIQANVDGFRFSDTGETYVVYPQLTIAVGETVKLEYTTNQGSNIPNLFGDIDNCWNIYEPNIVVDKPSTFTFDANGNITGIKAGTTGIGSKSAFIQKLGGNNDRIYIKVVNGYEENEYNNDFSYANTIKPNQKMKFRLSSSGDVDVFKFTRPAQAFNVIVKYEGDLGSSTGSRILSYDLYNSSYSLFGSGGFVFDASGGEESQARMLDTTQGYIKFYMQDEHKSFFTPNGYFTVEFKPK